MMTYEEAREILHPKTSDESLSEIESFCGFEGDNAKTVALVNACLTACEALDKGIAMNVIVKDKKYNQDFFCPVCHKQQKETRKNKNKGCYCERCGQKLTFNIGGKR